MLFALSILFLLGVVIVVSVNMSMSRVMLKELLEKGKFMARHLSEMSSKPLLTDNHFELRMVVSGYPAQDKDIEYAYVTDEDGRVLAHSFEDGFPSELRGVNLLLPGNDLSVENIETDNGPVIDIAYAVMDTELGTVHVGISEALVYGNVRSVTSMVMRIIIVALVIGAVISIVLAIRFTRPITELAKASSYIGKGDLERRVEVHTGDEIGELADTFNKMVDNLRDTDEQLRNEISKLERADEFINNILETVEVGIIVIDRNYIITSVNKAYCNQVRRAREDIIGKKCYEVSHGISRPCFEAGEDCAVKRTFDTGMPDETMHVHTDTEGNEVHVELRSYPLREPTGEVRGAIETLNDVTERIKLEDQLRQSQKMEAIGQLAGGIAHDFNNILTAIIGYSSIMKERLGEDNELTQYIENVLSSSERAASLTRGLLAYSRKQVLQPKPVEINRLIKDVESFLKRVIGEDIELRTILLKEGLVVLADRNQIQQVLINLATNARDAMPEGGTLTITTSRTIIDNDFIRAHGYGSPGVYAHITLSDTGQGIDPEALEKIFDPFFTTKEVGKGTGLGLSMAYGIIKQHQGNINAYSEKGRGTIFKIYLPLIEVQIDEEPVSRDEASKYRGTETVLFGEDDGVVRNLIRMVLKEAGYSVIEAVDGDDALKKYEENSDRIDILLLDVMMPNRTGKETFDIIKGKRPDIKVLFISGYTADFIKREKILEDGYEFVYKPISPANLLKRLRIILDN